MKITITAKKMQIPQNFTEYAEKRLSTKLDKFFGSEAEAKITMATHKNLIVIELTVTYNNLIYRAEQSAVDKEDALDASIDKIIRQIRKNKTCRKEIERSCIYRHAGRTGCRSRSRSHSPQEVCNAPHGSGRSNSANGFAGTLVLHVHQC